MTDIPLIGLGTFGRTGDDGLKALLDAIEIGYRHLDTAQNYNTEENVGRAIRESGLNRSEFFVTTKVGDQNLDRSSFLPSVEQSLETLGVDRVDLLLIHWPSDNDQVPFEDYMTDLAVTQQRGFARLIGVSNFTIDHLKRADALLGPDRLATNQIEIHPYLQSPRIRDYARSTALPLTAYMPLAKGRVSEDKVLAGIAAKHGVTPSAISLAFLIAEGHIVIPSSANRTRLADNLTGKDVTLTDDEMQAISALDKGARIIDPPKAPKWDD